MDLNAMARRPNRPGRVIFVGHGSPLNAIRRNDYTSALRAWSQSQPKPEAILVISAHWLTQGTFVSCQAQPRQIYDFYGFPDELYQAAYPCAGDPALAKRAVACLRRSPGNPKPADESWNILEAGCSQKWGIDHAAWAVLKHLFPKADLPVVEISLDMSKPPDHHYQLGQRLSELRRENVLIMGSGNLVHNLSLISWEENAAVPAWAQEMDERLKALLLAGDHKQLIDYPYAGLHGRLGMPTLDHYLPLLYVLGLQEKNERMKFIYEGMQNATVSMRCLELV